MKLVHSDFSKYDVYTEIGSPYCYKDSHVLRNKLGIRDFQALRQIEADITTNKQYYLLEHPIQGRFTATHLCNIHRFLFEDIYPFAGRLRLETIKKGTTTFESEKTIAPKLHKLLEQLRQEQYLQGLQQEAFIDRLVHYLAELNYIHPFREGNGRATREFFRLLILQNGYAIHWTAVGVEPLMDAMVQSVYDTQPLAETLRQCIQPINN